MIALLAGFIFGVMSLAVNASADCADIIPDTIDVSSEGGEECRVTSMHENRLFIRCFDDSGSLERTFTKTGGES